MVQSHVSIAEVERVYQLQRDSANLQAMKETTKKERIERIKRIENWILDSDNQEKIAQALWHDLRKSKEETQSTEIMPIVSCMHHIYSKLGHWMKDHSVSVPTAMTGISSYIKFEPKGHVLLIAPWNYPFQLALNPLIHAIAAGNVIILKPSEISAATSAIIKAMVSELFDEKEVAVVEGAIPVATALLEKPFNHIFFTGSPMVGKIVMRAASDHLCSVTLELGGKSPVVVDDSAKISQAAERVAWGKLMNNGQTCVAPDYLLIKENQLQEFVSEFEKTVEKFYNADGKGIQQSPHYTRIINEKNFKRIKGLVDSAVAAGAKMVIGGEMDLSDKFIAPVVLTGVNSDMAIMQEEIFGPVLPIMTYETLADAIRQIDGLPKPLAMYIMSQDKKNTEYLLNHTSAGGTAINELNITTVNPALPFGGVNNSGIGKSNGKYSFIEFSNERGVLKRKFMDFKMIYPPYNPRLFDLLLKVSKF